MKYFIKINKEPWKKVTKKEYIRYERLCGFYSKYDSTKIATASFGSSTLHGEIKGKVEYK